jgi:hypothetical protein
VLSISSIVFRLSCGNIRPKLGGKMRRPPNSVLRSNIPKKLTVNFTELEEGPPISNDGRSKFQLLGGQLAVETMVPLDLSQHSDNSIITEKGNPIATLSFESTEERPVRLVTWNVEEKKRDDEEHGETLSMIGRRKLKALQKRQLAEKQKKEAESWKMWLWSAGCPCLGWKPIYFLQGHDDQSMATSKAASTFVTRDEDGDDDSSIPSCSRVGSMLDGSISVDDADISDVSSNSSYDSLEEEEEEEEDRQTTPSPPRVEAMIKKDWSREGLSKNTILDMDVYINAMRS